MGMADDLTDSFKLLFFSRQYDAARDAIDALGGYDTAESGRAAGVA